MKMFSSILVFSILMIEGGNQFGQAHPQQNLQMSNMFPATYRVEKNRSKGAFNNYVDRILPLFDPPPCVDSFYTLIVDKNKHF